MAESRDEVADVSEPERVELRAELVAVLADLRRVLSGARGKR